MAVYAGVSQRVERYREGGGYLNNKQDISS